MPALHGGDGPRKDRRGVGSQLQGEKKNPVEELTDSEVSNWRYRKRFKECSTDETAV